MTNSICQVCKTNPVTLPVATTCSLECACKLNWDDYNAVRARLSNAIAEQKLWSRKNSKVKQ